MPADPHKRQKKQERRAAKRKEKHQQLAREKHAGLPERLASASRYPVLECFVTTDLWTEGLGYVGLSRALPNNFVALALFLVDRYCLGVKNILAEVVGRFTYDKRLRELRGRFTFEQMQPACACKLVEGAAEYARALGLHPHAEYPKARLIFGDINTGECTREFEYGKDGKPFYVAGPFDSLAKSRHVVNLLQQHCGPGGYDFLIPIAGETEVLTEPPEGPFDGDEAKPDTAGER